MNKNSDLKEPTVGRYYRHFKGGRYFVTGLAVQTETGDLLVLYHREGSAGPVWARPVASWNRPTAEGLVRFTPD